MKVNYSELKAVFNLCSLENLVAYHVNEIAFNDEQQSFTLRCIPSGHLLVFECIALKEKRGRSGI